MTANFEEKTYENYFNAELDRCSEIFFPLGQVQEGFLGFDSSANSRNRKLWRSIGFPFWFHPPFRGIELREIAREMERHLEISIESIPRMRANLLFQYKRPEYIKIRTGKEWNHWNRPYFRYDIYQKQQDLLNEIDSKFGNNVLTVYACPAIKSINELVQKKIDNQIIENSNFKKAGDLNGHHRNTYISSGNFSIACSEPERIENLDLVKVLESLGQNIKETNFSNRQFIINFQRQLSPIIEDSSLYGESFKKLKDDLSTNYYGKSELFYSMVIMNIVKQLTGLQWLVKL